MHIALIAETHFGNTAEIADALAAGARQTGATVTRLDAAATHLPPGTDLLVLAAPTHSGGLSTPRSRAQAVSQGAPESGRGVREWIAGAQLPDGLPAHAVATVTGPHSGSASRAIVELLNRRGLTATSRGDFTVAGTRGPLVEGEITRAREVGRVLAGGGVPTPVPAPVARRSPRRGWLARLLG